MWIATSNKLMMILLPFSWHSIIMNMCSKSTSFNMNNLFNSTEPRNTTYMSPPTYQSWAHNLHSRSNWCWYTRNFRLFMIHSNISRACLWTNSRPQPWTKHIAKLVIISTVITVKSSERNYHWWSLYSGCTTLLLYTQWMSGLFLVYPNFVYGISTPLSSRPLEYIPHFVKSRTTTSLWGAQYEHFSPQIPPL